MAHALSKIHHSNTYRMKYRKRSTTDRVWHEDATKVGHWTEDPTIEEVIQDLEAYVDVCLRPVYDCKGKLIPEIQETWRPFCDKDGNALLDSDGNPIGTRLGIVGSKYTPLQDHEVVRFFEPWIDADVASIDTAGAIFDHSRFWVLAKLKQDPVDIVKDDPVEQNVLAINGHDGTLAFRAVPTDIRAVCANTVSIVLESSLAKLFRKKHNSNIHLGIEEIRTEVEKMQGLFKENTIKFKELAAHDVKSEDDLKTYFQLVLKKKPDPSEEIKDDGKRALPTLMRLFEEDPTVLLPGVKGTYWAAYNCVTSYVTHLRARNSDARLDAMFNGPGVEMLSRALKIGLERVQ